MSKHNPTVLTILGLALLLLLLLAVNMFAGEALRTARVDLTEDKLYTLSDATKQVLGEIDEPVTFRFFYTKQLGDRSPAIASYADRIEELLDQYALLSDGKLRVEKYYPQPFSNEEDQAVAAGLRSVPYNAQGDLGFFGLEATNSTDDQKLVEFFSPERENFLEYDLTQIVYALSNPERRVLGLLSKLPLRGTEGIPNLPQSQQMPPWAVYSQLSELFEIREVPVTTDRIDPDVDVLMVVHPQQLLDKTLYAIDQFVLRGGKLMAFVDPYSEVQGGQQRGPAQGAALGNSEIYLEPLYEAWGAEVLGGQVAGDLEAAARVDLGGGKRAAFTEYVAWLNLTKRNLNADDVVTAQLENLSLGTAGIIELTEGSQAELLPLLVTSEYSQKIDVNRVRFRPDPVKLLNEFEPSGQNMVLGARITGTFKSAFPDGPPSVPQPADGPPPAEETEPLPPHIAEAAAANSVVLVADTDLLSDPFWLSPQGGMPLADNGTFVANIAESLTGRQDLIGLRSRGTSIRPFMLIEKLEREAEQRYRSEEQALARKLQESQEKFEKLQGQGNPENRDTILTQDQSETLEQVRAEIVNTRKELRRVQGELREDVNRVGTVAKVVNIVAMPLLVALIAIGLAIVRRARRARRAAIAD